MKNSLEPSRTISNNFIPPLKNPFFTFFDIKNLDLALGDAMHAHTKVKYNIENPDLAVGGHYACPQQGQIQ